MPLVITAAGGTHGFASWLAYGLRYTNIGEGWEHLAQVGDLSQLALQLKML